MRKKDKKIVDAYIKKHGSKLNPKKLEEYARKKGIYINVMDELEHRKMRSQMLRELNLPDTLDLDNEKDRQRVKEAIDSLPSEKKAEFMRQVMPS